MATSTKKDVSNNGRMSDAVEIALRPIKRKFVTLRIKSVSPMIQHQWAEKAKEMMREKHSGKKTKNREVRDPAAEAEAATYRTKDGDYGLPALALKAAIVGAAHKDLGIEKTLVRKALFIVCNDPGKIIPINCDPPTMHEDTVRVGNNAADLRYRNYFYEWSCDVTFELDAELLQTNDLIALIDRAGFGVGICEWRPEKGGEFGRFQVDQDGPIIEG